MALLQAIRAIIFWGVPTYGLALFLRFLRSLTKVLVPNFIWQKVAVTCKVYVRSLIRMDCLSTIFVQAAGKVHEVPCGKCAFCLVNKRSEWMFRIHHEMRDQDLPGWFLTLTYSEKKVPRLEGGLLSLKFRHVQLYLKKLRKRGFKAKYVCVGEYGAETARPHYHLLLWTDCSPEILEAVWEKGIVHFGKLTMASAMYTLKYIIQPKVWSAVDGREKARAQYSRGIGISYLGKNYREYMDVYEYHNPEYGRLNLFSYIDGRQVTLPRYYRRKIITNQRAQEERELVKAEKAELKAKEVAKLKAQGVEDVQAYQLAIRTEQAKRIIQTTKYNQTL